MLLIIKFVADEQITQILAHIKVVNFVMFNFFTW